jgi:hypothetical protein
MTPRSAPLFGLVAVVVGGGALLAACPTEVAVGGGGCDVDRECAEGLACQDGTCIVRCESRDDCDRGVCELSKGLCVDCVQPEDCGDGLVCNAFSNRCVQPIVACTGDGECAGLRCDTVKGSCVECLVEEDCGAAALCDFITSTCVTEQSCVTDGDCTASVCDPVAHTCVECFNPAHCASGVCDAATATCVVGCVDDDVTEPNDGSNAATISDGGAHEGTICPDDIDELTIAAEGTLSAVLTVDGAATLQVELFDAGGTLLASSTPTADGATLSAAGLAGAVVHLIVSGVSSTDAGDYLVSVNVEQPVQCLQLDAEPNDTTAQAPVIAGDDALHTGSICGADVDLYKFTSAAGDDIEVVAVAGDGAGTLAVAVLNGAGNVVATGNPATLTDVAAGAFFARVTASDDVTYSVRVHASSATPPCQQTDAEPNDADAQAIPLTADTTSSGSICPSDIDQHRFAATALDDVTVTIVPSGGDLSARLMRASDGAQLASGLSMSLSDVAGGGYRVVVQGSNATTQATYTVRVVLTAEPALDPCDEGTLEPDSPTEARALPLDGTPQTARICAADTDFFRFTLPFASTVSVLARFVHADGDLDMRLTDDAGAIITSAVSVTDDEIIVRALPAGTYGVEMFGFLGALNTFTMEATLQGCTPDDGFEQNNSIANATPIGGTIVSAARCPGDDDFYLIRLETGDALTATLAGLGLTFSLVSATNGAVLANDAPNGANRRIQLSGLPAGHYVLRVTGSGAERAVYTLTPSITATPARCIDDGAAPNDTSATAFPLDDAGLLDGSYQVGSLVSCFIVDADWFTLSLPGNKQVSVQLAFDPADDVDIELLERRGATGLTRSIARSFAVDKQDRVSGIVNAGAAFLLRAVGFDAGQASYGIGVEVGDPPPSSCVDDRFDTWTATSSGTGADAIFTNDAPASAVPVASGELFTSMRICSANADWLKINAAVGQRVVIHVDYEHELARDIDVRLYGPANQTSPVGSSVGTDGTEDISFVATASGDHFIEVFGFQSGENFYDVGVSLE